VRVQGPVFLADFGLRDESPEFFTATAKNPSTFRWIPPSFGLLFVMELMLF
jgi:hypothetical protein